jgi:hypothetical protein
MLVTVVQVQLDAVVHKNHLRPQGKLDNHPLLGSHLLMVGLPIRHCRNIVVLVAVADLEAVAVDPTQNERQENCQLVDMVHTVYTAQRLEEEDDVGMPPKGMRGGVLELATVFPGM